MQRFFDRLYLVRCFRQHKFLFFVSVLFVLAVLYGHKTTCEITPSVVMAVDRGIRSGEKDSLFLITINDSIRLRLSHTIDEPRRKMIYSTLTAYHRGVLAGYEDPQVRAIGVVVGRHPYMHLLSLYSHNTRADYTKYLPWLLRYLQEAVDKKIEKIAIALQYIHYDDRNLPVADSTHSLYVFQQTDVR